ncbi:MAG: PHP-associated domain-containing protein [Methanomicrobiales archaeon]|nr:PHP-associated domain-containing protein [Methanomicrobiales archaeon]
MVPIDSIVQAWEQKRLYSIVCDHDTIEGSKRTCQRIRERSPETPEVLAEEITTADGELIGLFLNEEVPPGLGAEETVDIVHAQGGLVLVPHPFCRYRSRAIRREVLVRLLDRLDIIEGYNARNVTDEDNYPAIEFAESNGLPISVGSDAHIPMEIAKVWMEVPLFETPQDLLARMKGARVCFRRSSNAVHIFTKMVKMMRKHVT